jgi:hypothetical protein
VIASINDEENGCAGFIVEHVRAVIELCALHDKARVGEDIFQSKTKKGAAANRKDPHRRLVSSLEGVPVLIQALKCHNEFTFFAAEKSLCAVKSFRVT